MDRFRELLGAALAGSVGGNTGGGTSSSGSVRMERGTGSNSSVSSMTSTSSARPRKDILELKNEIGHKYIIFMVGLPARGKSYICKKLCRYLSWCGFKTKVFNVGNRRRVMASSPSDAPPSPYPSSPLSAGDGASPSNAKPPRSDSTSETSPIHSSVSEKPRGVVPLRTVPQHAHESPVVATVPGSATTHDAKFFDASNADAKAVRERLAMDTLDELISWLKKGGKVAIHDATNSTVERRQALLARVEKETGIKAFFIESVCPDPEVLEQNVQMKLNGPDYKLMDPEVARRDFMSRIANYEKVYETISEEEEKRDVSYIKIVNVGQKVIAHHIRGYLPSQCVFYLMQIHIKHRTIWLTRHGESEFNLSNRIGGDPPLTPLGQRYTKALATFMKTLHPPQSKAKESTITSIGEAPSDTASANTISTTPKISISITNMDDVPDADGQDKQERDEPSDEVKEPLPVGLMSSLAEEGEGVTPLTVYTSTLRRTMDIADYFDPDEYEINNVRFLNEIYAGSFEGMTYAEVEANHPDEFAARARNKLLYRYPGSGGESYIDVIERLRPVIVELERMESDVLVVTHQVVMRTLLAYFAGIPLQEVPSMIVPLHTVYCLKPQPYGADLRRYAYNPDTDDFDYVGEGI
ncbi:6-phosphofructo-2-kinase-domain-containing protein [Entophlyctis helioformis]|nr:6-phosphofructo-2-kinase-domain-containing protein [Entophlyctis helioformis]